MVFHKEFSVKNKIFGGNDIILLWNFFAELPKSDLKGCSEIEIFNKDSTVKSNESDIFETLNFKFYSIDTVVLTYYGDDYRNKIRMRIHDEDLTFFSSNTVVVEGVSEEWVNACCAKIKDLISAVKDCSLICKLHNATGGLLESFLAGAIVTLVVTKNRVFFQGSEITQFREFKLFLVMCIIGLAALSLYSTSKLFRSVEIDVSGKKRKRRATIVKSLWLIISGVGLSIIGTLIYEGWLRPVIKGFDHPSWLKDTEQIEAKNGDIF